jgi:dienelactone hydrolase
VRTIELSDAALSRRSVPMEIWYPAAERFAGKDLVEANWDRYAAAPGLPAMTQQAIRDANAAAGTYPLFMYFHGGYGQRREASHLCTHLASHGYVVASADFPGDNMIDLIPVEGAEATVAKTPVDESARRRPFQASRFIDLLLETTLEGLKLDASRIGAGGISMGGFTALAINSLDDRLRAVFPMCPMFGERSMVPQVRRLQNLLHVDNWRSQTPTLLLTGDMDPLINVEDIRLLYSKIASPKRLVVLRKAGHMHFADNAALGHEWFRKGYLSGSWPDPEIDAVALGTAMRPFDELCTEAQSCGTARALCLAHMDAHLKENARAAAFLERDLPATFASALSVEIETMSDSRPEWWLLNGWSAHRIASRGDWAGPEITLPSAVNREP